MQAWRVVQVANTVNLTTPLGLAMALVGRASVRRADRGLLIASGYRYAVPRAAAFTVGNVVLTRHPQGWLEQRPRLLAHEERHTRQYAALLGLPFVPAYLVAAGWSYLRGGDHATHNLFETRAGLTDGGYALVSARQRRRAPSS